MWRDSSLVVLFLGALAGLTSSASAAGLDVPLTITETAGVARQSEPITFGVPVPQGLVRGVERLRLLSPDAKPVPAAFRVVNRWWDDGSVQWDARALRHGRVGVLQERGDLRHVHHRDERRSALLGHCDGRVPAADR